MNAKTKTRRPAVTQADARPASSNALAALLQRSSSAERKSFAKPAFQKRSQLPPLFRIGYDGLDHINFSMSAQTELGKLLSLRTVLDFTYDQFGKFTSIDGFQYYIRSKHHDDLFRDMAPIRGRQRAEKEPMHPRVDNQRALVIDAMYQRICQYDALKKAVLESELPFDFYALSSDDTRNRPVPAEWLVEGMELIRKTLKAGHSEPLLLDYLDENYQYLGRGTIKAKLAHQRRMLRMHFLSIEEVDQLEINLAEAERVRQSEAAAADLKKRQEAEALVKAEQERLDARRAELQAARDAAQQKIDTHNAKLAQDAREREAAALNSVTAVSSDSRGFLVALKCEGVNLMATWSGGTTDVFVENSEDCFADDIELIPGVHVSTDAAVKVVSVEVVPSDVKAGQSWTTEVTIHEPGHVQEATVDSAPVLETVDVYRDEKGVLTVEVDEVPASLPVAEVPASDVLMSVNCVGRDKYGKYGDGQERIIERESLDCGGHGQGVPV